MGEGNGAGSEERHRHARRRRAGSSSPWQAQRLPVLLAVGGAVLALVIGSVAAQSGSQSQANTPLPSAAALSLTTHQALSPAGALAGALAARRTKTVPASSAGPLPTAGAAAGAPGPCTPADLTITTTTDRSSYRPGVPVTAATKLLSKVVCELDLVPGGQFDCAESVVVDTWSGGQMFPVLGQGEQCGNLMQGIVTPGTADSATIVWNQRTTVAKRTGRASPGRYEATGSWSWSAGGGEPPYQVAVVSQPFVLLP